MLAQRARRGRARHTVTLAASLLLSCLLGAVLGGGRQEAAAVAPAVDGNQGNAICVDYEEIVKGVLYQFHPPPDSKVDIKVDIVFVHGLQPTGNSSRSWRDTWTSENNKDGRAWPDELLSEDLPRARILSFSYDSAALSGAKRGRWHLHEVGKGLITHLQGKREDSERPVVFVAHSLGGLVVKQACVELSKIAAFDTRAAEQEAASRFLSNIKGVVFYGTPHAGSRLADWLKPIAGGKLVEYLPTLNEPAASLHHDFMRLRDKYDWRTVAFCEKHETYIVEVKGHKAVPFHIVPEASACAGMEEQHRIDADHTQVCKPTSRTEAQYYPLVDNIKGWVPTAGPQRWEEWLQGPLVWVLLGFVYAYIAIRKEKYPVMITGVLYKFYEPPIGKPTKVDIVFVHGFEPTGNPRLAWRDTWTSSYISYMMVRRRNTWPDEWLSRDMPVARMLSFSYGRAALQGDQGRLNFDDVGKKIITNLLRVGVGHRPVVFVAHSLGGLVVKQACIELDKMAKSQNLAEGFLSNIKGVVFYGTPHADSHLADWLAPFAGGLLVAGLRTLTEEVDRLHTGFMSLRDQHNWGTLAFCEKSKTCIPGTGDQIEVVSVASASKDMLDRVTVDADHVGVCKPADKDAEQYKALVHQIWLWVVGEDPPPELSPPKKLGWWNRMMRALRAGRAENNAAQ